VSVLNLLICYFLSFVFLKIFLVKFLNKVNKIKCNCALLRKDTF